MTPRRLPRRRCRRLGLAALTTAVLLPQAASYVVSNPARHHRSGATTTTTTTALHVARSSWSSSSSSSSSRTTTPQTGLPRRSLAFGGVPATVAGRGRRRRRGGGVCVYGDRAAVVAGSQTVDREADKAGATSPLGPPGVSSSSSPPVSLETTASTTAASPTGGPSEQQQQQDSSEDALATSSAAAASVEASSSASSQNDEDDEAAMIAANKARIARIEAGLEEMTREKTPKAVDVYPCLPTLDVAFWESDDASVLDDLEPSSSKKTTLEAAEHPFVRRERHVIDLERGAPCADPFALVADDLNTFSDAVKAELTVPNDELRGAARLYFEQRQGKRFRPTIVGLAARALPRAAPTPREVPSEAADTTTTTTTTEEVTTTRDSDDEVLRKQKKLGQITEMIHVASLIHDDVLDDAETRRGGDAIHVLFSNKVAVFSGDYLLARASVMLALLGSLDVVQVMAKALDSLVAGEIMQIKVTQAAAKKSKADGDERSSSSNGGRDDFFFDALAGALGGGSFVDRYRLATKLRLWKDPGALWKLLVSGLHNPVGKNRFSALKRRKRGGIDDDDDDAEFRDELLLYLKKSYFKTASLICDACKSTALLAGYALESSVARGCEEYGFHLGIAFQIVDDVLDYGPSDELGKPAGADLSLGLATAPILYASRDYPELRVMIDRRFKGPGDVTRAYNLVRQSEGLSLAMRLARFHAQKAVDAICKVAPDSEYRDGLISLCYLVLTRNK